MKKEKLQKLTEEMFKEEIQQIDKDNRAWLEYRTVLGFKDKRLDQHLKILMSAHNCPEASKSNTWKWWDDVRETCVIAVLQMLKEKGYIPEDVKEIYTVMDTACEELTKDSDDVEFADYLTRSGVSNRGFVGNKIDEQQSKNWNSWDEQETEEYKRLKKIKFNKILKNSPEQKKILHMFALDKTGELKQKDIAQIFNCSEANISQQLSKIRHKIDKHYPEKELQTLHPAPFGLMIEKAIRTYKKYTKEYNEKINYIELMKKLVVHDFKYDINGFISWEDLVANRNIKTNINIGDFLKEADDYMNNIYSKKDYYSYWNLKSFKILKLLIEKFTEYNNKLKRFYKEQNYLINLKNAKYHKPLIYKGLKEVNQAKIG